jgi:glycosyltransferase involved in cell wall biosynthesis
LISVIVPNFNHARYLEKRLESVLTQTYQNIELIILDDCSSDNSIDIINKYKTNQKVSSIVLSNVNSGSPFKQWSRGIEIAKGDYIWIAESDDYCDNTFLEKCLAPFETDMSLVMVFCGSHWVDDQDIIKEDLSLYNKSFIRDGVIELKYVLSRYNSIQNVSSVLFSTKHLRSISSRYTNYKSCGDWILYSEILQLGRIQFISDKLNYFRWYHTNTSNISSKVGLWEFEGIDVLKIISTRLNFTRNEKDSLVYYWKNKVETFTVNGCLSFFKYLIMIYKIFMFSNFSFLKIYFTSKKKLIIH